MVNYKNKSIRLEPAISGSGAKFGMPSAPWGWWTKGNEGFIYQTGGDEAILDSCHEIIQNEGQTNSTTSTVNPIAKRKWSVYGKGQKVSVADCVDCEEDIGMLIQCQEKDQPALVTLHWLAGDKEIKSKTANLQIKINNKVYQRVANTAYFGMIGHTPQFLLTKSDPLIKDLQNANQVSFTFDSVKAVINLHGSKKAIEQFKSSCGWY